MREEDHKPTTYSGHADLATLFLDEVGELSNEMQVALLRVLQEGEFERLESSQTRPRALSEAYRANPRTGTRPSHRSR